MSCAQFVTESFAVRTAAHLRHLSATTYASHVALGEFYEELTELTDKYAEVSMGLDGIQISQWPAAAPPKVEAIPLLEMYQGVVRDQQKEDKTRQSLLNILAEMEELTARSLYKLRFLK